MSMMHQHAAALDYHPCRYGESRIEFRGPKSPLDAPYVAVLGGSEAYGRYVRRPFPTLLAERLNRPVVNLGCMNAGLSIFSTDATILQVATHADVCVLQVLGAQNMSNRLYKVHPRRNDRFLSASVRMQRLFPDVDFSQINFTGHLVKSLAGADERSLEVLHGELRHSWLSRMRGLLQALPCPVVLVWLAPRRPDDPCDINDPFDPLYVTREMLDALLPDVAEFVEVTRLAEDAYLGKHFLKHEKLAAAALPGPHFHSTVAGAVAEAVQRVLGQCKTRPAGAGRVASVDLTVDQSFSINSGTAVKRSATSP